MITRTTKPEQMKQAADQEHPSPALGNGSAAVRPIGTAFVAVLAVLLVALVFLIEGRRGINLADEGFLWYGTWRTTLGQVPMQDFVSYDPARYYWGAAWSSLFGTGLMALRLSTAVFQAFALTLGLSALKDVLARRAHVVLAGSLLILWMYPRHKLFDCGIALITAYVGTWFLKMPTAARFFGAGMFVGLSAFFGRNHGLYAVLTFLILSAWVLHRSPLGLLLRRIFAAFAGVVIGYSPMLVMLTVNDRFRGRFVELLVGILKQGRTNLTLPVPWPWNLGLGGRGLLVAVEASSTSVLFVALPVLAGVSLISAVVWSRREDLPPVLLASAVTGAIYLHFAFSRADLPHLAQGGGATVMAAMALAASSKRRGSWWYGKAVASCVWILSLGALGVHRSWEWRNGTEPIAVRGDTIYVNRDIGHVFRRVSEKVLDARRRGETFLAAPYSPGFYAALEQESPWWNISALTAESENRQVEMIEDVKKKRVGIVVMWDIALDGLEERRFRNTHPLIWKWFLREFELDEELGSGFRVWRRRIPSAVSGGA